MDRKVLIGLPRNCFTQEAYETALQRLRDHGFEVSCFESKSGSSGDYMHKEEMLERIGDMDACIHYSLMDREVAEAAKKLKILAALAIGYDSVDVPACKERGIKVTIARVPEHANGVAEIALMLMMMGNYDAIKHHRETVSGVYNQYMLQQLYGKTLGFVGFGWIGQRLARLVQPFHMRLLAYDLYPNPQAAAALDAEYVSLDELLAQSDFVSLHTPATPENYHLFDAEKFAKMKPGAQFINTSRGVNVDEDALYDALVSGHLKSAAVDVMENEGADKRHPLFELDNFCVMPHIGGCNFQARDAMLRRCVQNVIDCFEGREPPYQVWH